MQQFPVNFIMSVPTLQDFLARNNHYSKKHVPHPTFQDMIDNGYPTPKTVIICCADPRSNPSDFLELQGGKSTDTW